MLNTKSLCCIRGTRYSSVIFAFLLIIVLSESVFAQSGRVEGTVIDAETEEQLFGVNIYIEELGTGTTTNSEGYYSIVNVPPGEYSLRVTYVGYAQTRAQGVEVNIDQTTTIDIEMQPEAIAGEEVVFVAERPVVERDVSASTRNIGRQDFENLPAADLGSVVGLQAGIQGLQVRGSDPDQLSFQLDGLALRDERDNTPFTGVSYTAIQEIQVQTGGFNAEYGDLRSGLINIVTREGHRERYQGDVVFRYRPPGNKHFGPSHNNPDSYFIRPFLDDEVAWTGTDNGNWDRYTQDKYPGFVGWNTIAENTMQDGDPSTDLTPRAAQQLFLWQHRKEFDITEPDYDLDMSFGGPVPGIGQYLGDLRFFASYRRSQNMYTVPLSRDRYTDYTGHLKLTSDITEGAGMKLTLEGLFGRQTGTNSNNSGLPGIFTTTSGILGGDGTQGGGMSRVSYIESRKYSTDYWAPTQVDRFMVGGKFTHTLSSDTYYEARLNHFVSDYDTNPGRARDTGCVQEFGNNYCADEAPFGFYPGPSDGIGSGMRMGVGMSNSRDSSYVGTTNFEFDITSQLNRYMQVKTGVHFVHTNSQVNYAAVDEFLPSGRTRSAWNKQPLRGALYGQTKLEFEGMVANLGLRMDYSHANTDWYEYDDFEEAFAAGYDLDEELEKVPTEHQVNLSPRLGVSFPITVDSKLYFNYGHFRSMPTPENLYMVREQIIDDQVTRIANPNIALPKTVSYELGYEHSLWDAYLVRVAGYYKDVSNQPALVSYQSMDGRVEYSVSHPWNFEDTRGAEITLEKRRGDFIRGFINYTYMIDSWGNFGFNSQYENPATQRQFERDAFAQAERTRPVPRPFARANIQVLTPSDFGPSVAGFDPLSNWTVSFLASWQSGRHFTWAGGGAAPPGIQNNVQWRDSYNVDLRLGKDINVGNASIEFFADINNLFNFRHMSQWASYGFYDGEDYNRYMRSLHLPEDVLDDLSYAAVPGNDQPGDFRDPDVDFHPIESISSSEALPSTPDQTQQRPFYYSRDTGNYYQFSEDEGWVEADQDKLQEVLDTRAYINMPNLRTMTFLNPRSIYWGIKISF